MTGENAIGMNMFQNYGYDPYFMNAYQSFNPNFKGIDYTSQAATNPVTTSAGINNIPTQTATTQITQKPKEKNSRAGLILSGVAVVGATVLLYKAHKKGGEKGITEGLKQIWQGITNKAGTEKETFKIAQQNGKWYAQIPGRKQAIKPEDAEKLGIKLSDIAPKLGEKGTELKVIEFTHNGNKFRVAGDGRVLKYTNSAGEDILNKMINSTEAGDVEYAKTISEIFNKLKKGEAVDGVDVLRQYFTHTENGVTRKYLQNAGEAVATASGNIRTNRFALDSDAVIAYGTKHEGIEAAVKQIQQGKIPESLKIANATYKVDNTHSLVIKDGQIIGLSNGKFHNSESDAFIAFKKKFPNVFQDVENLRKDKKLTDIVYAV